MSESIPLILITNPTDINWQSELDVLEWLSNHPEDRTHLLMEAYRRSPHRQRNFYVGHPLLRNILKVNSFYFEEEFLFIIQDLIWKIEYPRRIQQILDARSS